MHSRRRRGAAKLREPLTVVKALEVLARLSGEDGVVPLRLEAMRAPGFEVAVYGQESVRTADPPAAEGEAFGEGGETLGRAERLGPETRAERGARGPVLQNRAR